MPFPSALDNGVKRLELRSPAKLVLNFFRGSDKSRWVAGSAWLFNRVDLSPGDFAAGRDYLPNTGAASCAEVVESAGSRAKRQNVRARKINNMNVVTNTCSVGRRIISAVNFNHVSGRTSVEFFRKPVSIRRRDSSGALARFRRVAGDPADRRLRRLNKT